MADQTSSPPLTLYALRVEGQNFKWVLYDTHDLSASAGGSRLLEDIPGEVNRVLNAAFTPGSGCYEAIKTTSSTAVYACCCSRENMVKVLRALRLAFREDDFAHLTVAVEAIEVEQDVAEPCKQESLPAHIKPEHLEKLETAIRYAQMESLNAAVPSQNGEKKACEKDHLRPKGAGENRKWSESVFARRERGKTFRREFVVGGREKGPIKTARTFEGLTSLSDLNDPRHRKLAVISIDGNGFGNVIAEYCQNGHLLKQFSDELKKRQNEFEDSLLENWLAQSGEENYFIRKSEDDLFANDGTETKSADANVRLLRLQRLVTAGDDALYVMPAWLAWEFLERFFKVNWTLSIGDPAISVPLTFRTGLVICHHNAPIHRIRELADRLSKLARDDAKEAPSGKRIANPIAYEVLKSFDLIGPELGDYRTHRVAGKLRPDEMLLDGKQLESTLKCLRTLEEEMPAGMIKDPSKWPARNMSRATKPDNEATIGAYHLSQLREFLPS